jgi:capsular exopolysaccharide synthesis family protein
LSVVPNIRQYIKDEHDGRDFTQAQGMRVSTSLVSFLDNLSPVAESFRRLESNILHSNPDAGQNCFMVTSTTKGEGKTTIAANLGVVMAEADQKVIIVDTDLRRPQLHNMFGVERSPGIVDVLFENTGLDEVLKETVVPGLHVLCAGKRPPNPSAIAKSASFLTLIEKLKKQYDRVLLDTSPFGIIADSSSLIKTTDGVIVVARFDETNTNELQHTLNILERVEANTLGTVLNGFEAHNSSDNYYGNNYYQEFYRDYNAYEEA